MMDKMNNAKSVDFIAMVAEWHKRFKQPCPKTFTMVTTARLDMRTNIMVEEVLETQDAHRNGDIIAIADGLADQMYVLCGTIVEFGLADKFGDIFAEVHRSNMSKLGEDGKPILRHDGKVMKGKFFDPPHLEKILL